MAGDSQTQSQTQSQPESLFGRRASEGDVLSGISGAQEDGHQEQELSHSSSQPGLKARPGISPTSSSMTRAYSNQEVQTLVPTPTQTDTRPNPQISVPASLLPQAAGVDRPSSDSSLMPLIYPTVHQTSPDTAIYPPLGANEQGSSGSRPQSRTTAASITPPNIYDFLPHNLYASLHIHPQDPRLSLSSNGSNGVHSPVSPTMSSAAAGPMHQPYGVWVPPLDEQPGGLPSHYGYGMPPLYQRTSSRGGMDSQGSSFSAGGDGRPGNGGQHPGYLPTPDTNMAFRSMHQALEPQQLAGMGNGFAYQPMYQYHDGRQGAFGQPAWMSMAPNGYPYANYQFAGNQQYGPYGYQDNRGRGRGRGGRGRGRGTGFRAGDHYAAPYPGQNMPHSPAQGSGTWHDQAQWHTPGRQAPSNNHYARQAYQSNQTPADALDPLATEGAAAGHAVSSGPAANANDSGREPSLADEAAGRLLERKPYHPAPPANRSEWVMWVGNVPANATHEEMWKFFNSPLHWDGPQSSASAGWLGVASIFLISRSNCAFVNLKNENDLKTAIAYFNGKTLRPWDPRCQPFLCRVRKADDDLKSGVGGQRGAGLHIKYIKDLRAKEAGEAALEATSRQNTVVPSSFSQTLADSTLPISPAALEEPPEGEGRRRESVVNAGNMISPAAFAAWQDQQLHGRSPSGEISFASTCSSFLVRNFPKRYLIMKSSTKEELDRSIKQGTWWTQPHNEPILDQAYRTSPEVYLIFGANKQGSFSGYAVMRSGIPAVARKHGSHSSQGHDASYSSNGSRSSKKSATLGNTRNAGLLTPRGAAIQEEGDEDPAPPTRHARLASTDSTSAAFAMSSPGEMTPGDELRSGSGSSDSPLSFRWNQTAPHPDYSRISMPGNLHGRAMTFDTKALARIRAEEALKQELSAKAKAKADEFELDEEAVRNAQRDHAGADETADQRVAGKDMISNDESHAPAAQKAMAELGTTTTAGIDGPANNGSDHRNFDGTDDSDDKGQHSFKVEWVRIGELSFSSIKHLRNPWNQDKEVKVSRDGTELEPAIGSALLAEWNRLGDSTLPGSQTSVTRP